jgi:hypothetical protein
MKRIHAPSGQNVEHVWWLAQTVRIITTSLQRVELGTQLTQSRSVLFAKYQQSDQSSMRQKCALIIMKGVRIAYKLFVRKTAGILMDRAPILWTRIATLRFGMPFKRRRTLCWSLRAKANWAGDAMPLTRWTCSCSRSSGKQNQYHLASEHNVNSAGLEQARRGPS